jgi:hypothetical protein
MKIIYGERVCEALREEDYTLVAELIKNNDGDIIGHDLKKDSIYELLESLRGSLDFQVLSEIDYKIIEKKL